MKFRSRHHAEWLGDAILSFYVRQKLLECFPEETVGQLAIRFDAIISNSNLRKFATFQKWKFPNANHVEEQIAIYATSPLFKVGDLVEAIIVFTQCGECGMFNEFPKLQSECVAFGRKPNKWGHCPTQGSNAKWDKQGNWPDNRPAPKPTKAVKSLRRQEAKRRGEYWDGRETYGIGDKILSGPY